MRFRLLLSALMLSLFATAALAADPVGHYTIEGTNPGGGGAYQGTVDVTQTGDTYQIVWTINGARTIGTAVGNKDFMASAYKSGKNSGLALYSAEGGNWAGAWTSVGGTTLGAEHWMRQ